MKKIGLLVFLSLMSGLSQAHNYFVSIANMEYNDEQKSIDVSIKLTAHDFEHVLEDKFNQRVHIEHVADTSEIGIFIQSYLKQNLILSSQNQLAEMAYIGKEVTLREELFFYLSFTGIVNPASIHIKNTLLFTQFAQQQNIVHYKFGELSKSVTLVTSKPESELIFD